MSYLMPKGPWQVLPAWPVAQAHQRTLALTRTAGLAATNGEPPGHLSYVVNPGAGVLDLPSDDHLVFTGSPLAAPETVGGSPVVHLIATLTDPTGLTTAIPATQLADANFVFHLYDVTTSGTRTVITRGFLKASQYRSHALATNVPLNKPISYTIPLWHINYRIAAGDHLELFLESGDRNCCLSAAPALAQPMLPLTVTVETGRGGSTLSLPVTGSSG
jgi:predicted acyl esterase